MPNVILKLAAIGLAAALAGCHSAADQTSATSQDMSIDDNLDQSGGNVDVETLPADESSATSNAELSAGAADDDGDAATNGDSNNE